MEYGKRLNPECSLSKKVSIYLQQQKGTINEYKKLLYKKNKIRI